MLEFPKIKRVVLAALGHLKPQIFINFLRCRGQDCTQELQCNECKGWFERQWKRFIRRHPFSNLHHPIPVHFSCSSADCCQPSFSLHVRLISGHPGETSLLHLPTWSSPPHLSNQFTLVLHDCLNWPDLLLLLTEASLLLVDHPDLVYLSGPACLLDHFTLDLLFAQPSSGLLSAQADLAPLPTHPGLLCLLFLVEGWWHHLAQAGSLLLCTVVLLGSQLLVAGHHCSPVPDPFCLPM